jgi:tRNA(Ile)-lysidine synthase
VAEYIKRHNLFKDGDTLIVGVSGGADSVALLDLLAVTAGFRLNLVVAHLNHSLRGEESDGDALFVKELAERYGMPVVCRKVDVKGLSREKRISLEEAGRMARRQFFSDLVSAHGANAVALAHHADDQAETVLLRLIRGGATTGLSAMSPRSGIFIRPFLEVTRQDIEHYCKARSLAFRTDSSNIDLRFLRNRIRHELIPYLKGYNPAIAERLTASASVFAADEALLERIIDSLFNRAGRRGDEEVLLEIACFAAEPLGSRLRLYRRAIQLLTGDLASIAYSHLQAIDSLVSGKRPNATLTLPNLIAVTRSYGELRFHRRIKGDEFPVDDFLIEGEGSYLLSGGGSILVDLVPAPVTMANVPPTVAYINPEEARFPWYVRNYRAGDRFRPLGVGGGKKLKDFFIDNKVPMEQRRRIPLLFCGERLLWVCGMRLACDPALKLTGEMSWRVEFVIP